jgi:hypothetical protein
VTIAKAGLLSRSEYPPEWQEGASIPWNPADNPAAAADPSCKHFREYRRAQARATNASSPQYLGPEGQNDDNVVFVFASEADAIAAMAAYGSPDVPKCLSDVLTAAVKRGASPTGSVTVRRTAPPKIGDDALAFDEAVTLDASAEPLQSDSTLIEAVRVGRVVSEFTFLHGPIDATVRGPAMESTVDHLRRSQN